MSTISHARVAAAARSQDSSIDQWITSQMAARREGRQEALDQAIRKLEASGQDEAAKILRSQNGE